MIFSCFRPSVDHISICTLDIAQDNLSIYLTYIMCSCTIYKLRSIYNQCNKNLLSHHYLYYYCINMILL